jgi:hypothetical protein
MNKNSVITGFIAVSLVVFSISTAAAQQLNASTSADVRAGGLGTGLNSMVRSILGEQSNAPVAPSPAPAALMMSAEAAADMSQPQERAMKASASNAMISLQAAAQTEEDVSALIRSLLQNNADLQSIDASDTHVRLTYRAHGTVLRFLKVSIPVTGEAYISGKTTVSYPWYAGMAGLNGDIRARFEERIAPLIQTETLSPETRIQLISEMHAFFTEEFSV